MTNQLIPVFNGTISNETILLCNARELHTFLMIGKRFTSWVTERISEYGFIENQDFIAISQKREIGHGRGRKDYHLTLDTAKELAMVERNEQGRKIRRYFIECEKKLHQPSAQAASQPTHRYYVEVHITDRLLGGSLVIPGQANTFKQIAFGLASDLGYKPTGFVEVPDAIKELLERRTQ